MPEPKVGGLNIETERGATLGERSSRVAVNNVPDFFTCPSTMNDPVILTEI